MKKQVLIPLLISLFAVTAWADVSVTERFSQVGEILNSNVSKTEIRTVNGDLCQWEHRGNRRDTTTDGFSDKMASGKLGWWTSGSVNGNLLRTKDAFEGGIKRIDLEWKQSSTAAGATVVVDVIVGATTFHPINYTGGNASTTVATTDQHASFDCNIKQNTQISVTNLSTTTNKAGRILIGDITITPYLLFTQKKVVISPLQTGYINAGFIDNTASEGSITYSIHDKDAVTQNVAEVNASNGAITPKAVGKAIVTATWSEGATTSYELIVANTVVEAFTNVVQTGTSGSSGSTWVGDICTWSNKHARRKSTDLISSNQATWLTLDGSVRGFIKTTTLEGGIVGVSFNYAQFGTEANTVLIWKTSDGTNANWVTRDGDIGKNPNSPDTYSYIFENKENAQLEILNASIMDNGTQPTSNARLLMSDITIAPYLLYTTKEAALDTRNGVLTYTNNSLVDNTAIDPGTDIVYSISSMEGLAGFDTETGEVTATDNTQGEYTITATWGDVSTSYVLAITSRNETSASFSGDAIVNLGLSDDAPTKTLTYTAGYDGTSSDITYSSNNTEVATVANDGTVTLAGGVGQAIITAHLAQTANYKAAEASYIIQVTDDGANVLEETFSAVPKGNAATHTDKTWEGDLFNWYTTQNGGIRKNGDKFPSDNTDAHTGIWMSIPTATDTYATLQSAEAVEGGIKHLSFYWEQWGTESEHILNPVIYIKTSENDPVQKASVEYTPTGSPVAANRLLIGINDVRSNSQLIIRNESHKSDGSRVASQGRIILDEIHITPYLLYTTKEAELDLRVATTYTNTALIDNTESGSVTYSLDDNDEEATIDAESGEVTGLKVGQVTVKATWSEGAYTTYTLNIISITETEASYPNAEIHATMGEAIPANALAYTDGYDGEISYASSVPTVADFVNGVLTLKAPGQTKITATLPETSNYTAATASYILTVSYANYESFNPNTTTSTYAKPEENAQGDMCKWYTYIGGIQTPNYFSSNAITMRAQRTNETKQGYVKSTKLSGGISALAFNYSMMFEDNDIENWDIHVYVNDRLVGQLTNEAGGDLEGINGRTLNPMRTKVITGINEPGKFVIRFENHSTVKNNVEYETGNKGRFAIDNVSWENYDGAIVLDEEEDNSAVLAVNSGSIQDVDLARSTLLGGYWNTLCLPFALPVSTLGVVENGVQTLSGATLNGDELTISFTSFTGETLVAGIPYLVKPANDINISGTYEDKQIASIASTVVSGPVTLQGIFSPIALQANDYSTLFVGAPDPAGNNLYYPSADGTLKGFRAYFKIADDVAPSAPLRRARFVINEQQVATELDATGQLVEPLRKQIQNGQLIIIRDGVRYDVLGRKL